MKNITKRDVKAFLLGVLFLFALDVIFDWKENKEAFWNGYNAVNQTKK